MTDDNHTPTPDTPDDDNPDVFDLSNLTADSVPADAVTPDHSASRDKRRWFGKDKAQDKPRERTRPSATRSAAPRMRKGQLVKPLTDLYTAVGTMMVPFDQPCGIAVISNAEQCAVSLDNLAQQNEAVRRALFALIQTSTWGTVLAAHAPILLAIAMHHVPSVRGVMANVGSAMGQQFADTVEQEMQEGHTD